MEPAQDYSQLVDQAQDQALCYVPLDAVSVKQGFNPRRFFEPNALAELTEDIKLRGIVQPLVVRPNDNGGFWLIAGERRYRAAKAAELTQVPVMVRHVSESEAAAMAAAENGKRDDMSPAEEARLAHRLVSLSDGDRDEAARLLAWSRDTLDNRLLLLHCSDAVLEALERRAIKLGHAELLAGLTKEFQDQTLSSIIENGVSVKQLKESIGRYAYALDSTFFDVSGCAKCAHNSSTVVDMFDQSLNAGQCLNRECFDQKTETALLAKKEELKTEHPVIWLDTEKDAEARVFLQREGANGVGKRQYEACMGCGNCGALLRTNKSNLGQVETGLCFEPGCNEDKVKAYQKEQKAHVTSNEAASKPAKEQTAKSATAPTRVTKSADPKKPAALPGRLQDLVRDTHCNAAVAVVGNNPRLVRIVAVFALYDGNRSSDAARMAIEKAGIKSQTHGRDALFTALAALSDDALATLIPALAAALAGDSGHTRGDELKGARTLLRHAKTDLADHFVVDKGYLKTLTIAMIQALLTEAKFDVWFDGQKGDKAYEGFLKINKKRDDLIEAVMKAGFDWKGFVPSAVAL